MSTPAPRATDAETSPFPHGAEWVRVDFHLHTRADREFHYQDGEHAYVNSYVSALAKAGIRLGIITNHNKFKLDEFNALRTAARKQGIGLLPGMELSVGDGTNGVHTLVVFSDDWIRGGHDHINLMIPTMFKGQDPEDYERENGRSRQNIVQTLETLESYHKDFFLVFAHVEQKSGLWKELGGGRLTELGQNPVFRERTLGFQKVRTHDEGAKGGVSRTQVQQWFEPWYPAEVEGCDAKRIEDIGKGKACYIKLGELSFDALRFALTDPQRVQPQPPVKNTSYISSLAFEGGVLDGKTVLFSPELNTLIGIRGSGKSSILEALRYALDIPRGEQAQDIPYKDELVRHTLGSGGKITVTAHNHFGQTFTVSRIFREPPNVYLDGELQPGISIRETVLRKPIFFGQKDLSSTGEGFEADLIEKLIGEKLTPLRTQIASQRQRVEEAGARYLKLGALAEQKQHYEEELANANFHLQQFEKHGLANKLQKRLDFESDAVALKRIREHVAGFAQDLAALLARHEDDLLNATHYASRQNEAFFAAYYVDYAKVIDALNRVRQAGQDIHTATEQLDQQQQVFDQASRNLQDEFAQTQRQIADALKQNGITAVAADDFLQQQKRKLKAEQMLAVLAHQQSQQQAVLTALLREVDMLNRLWHEEFQTIQGELERVNAGHLALQIEAEFKGNQEAAVHFLQQMLRGNNFRETRLRELLKDYADFGDMFRQLEEASQKAGSTPELFRQLFLQHLMVLLTWQVPNRFTIRYRGKELRHHSLGQRASALMLYVLSQRENDVIIIDQPEDDLDNQTIYEDVIKLIRQMKPTLQFIFATHNANFPVLGDAEQVIACSYHDDKIDLTTGSLDAHSIQGDIIRIMEGGTEAFNKRKEVYRQWKPQNSSKPSAAVKTAAISSRST